MESTIKARASTIKGKEKARARTTRVKEKAKERAKARTVKAVIIQIQGKVVTTVMHNINMTMVGYVIIVIGLDTLHATVQTKR